VALVRRVFAATLILLFGLAEGSLGDTPPPSEYAVKAAFLVKFADYVEWPAAEPRSGPFVIGILGGDPFGAVLDRMVEGKQVRGRALRVRRFDSAEDAVTEASILFVAADDETEVQRIFRVVSDKPILTVGDTDQFAQRGGMIGFRVQGKTVRFDINADRANRSALRISSQLQKLARVVKGGA
jgi:hypothetical protein